MYIYPRNSSIAELSYGDERLIYWYIDYCASHNVYIFMSGANAHLFNVQFLINKKCINPLSV